MLIQHHQHDTTSAMSSMSAIDQSGQTYTYTALQLLNEIEMEFEIQQQPSQASSQHTHHSHTPSLRNLHILFWNACGLQRSISSLDIMINNGGADGILPDIFAFTETHWPSSKPMPRLNGYTWHATPLQSDNSNYAGGLALLVNDKIALQQTQLKLPTINTPHMGSTQACWYEVRKGQSSPLLLGLVYRGPASRSSTTQQIINAMEAADQLSSCPVLVVGDCNIRHSDWDYQYDSHSCNGASSTRFSSFINGGCMHLMNTVLMPGVVTRPSEGTHRTDNIGSVIDLALSNKPGTVTSMGVAHDWVDGGLNSDHLPILVDVDLSNKNQTTALPSTLHHQLGQHRIRYNIHRNEKDWQDAFPTACAMELGDFIHKYEMIKDDTVNHSTSHAQQLINNAMNEFTRAIHAAATRVVGIKNVHHEYKHWFGMAGVREAHDIKVQASKRYRSLGTQASLEALKAAQRHWKQISKQAKALSWLEFTTQVQSDPESQLVWSVFKRSLGSTRTKLNSFVNAEGTLPSCIEMSLDNATLEIVRTAVPPLPNPLSIQQDIEQQAAAILNQAQQHEQHHISSTWSFSFDDVKKRCKRIGKTAPGPDSILPQFLKYGGDAVHSSLSAMFEFSFRHSVLPDGWTLADIILLYKGKGSTSIIPSFRPISVTAIVCRTFEHLFHKHMVNDLHQKSFFSNILQFGFRSKHCTGDALYQLLDFLRQQINKTDNKGRSLSRSIPVAFLDLKKAFDRVCHHRLLVLLHDAGIDGLALQWIAAFLNNRYIRVIDNGGTARWQQIHHGVPQGSVLSPLLFLIFINLHDAAVLCSLCSDVFRRLFCVACILEFNNPSA